MKKTALKAITVIMAFILLSSCLSVFALAAGVSFTDDKTGVVVTVPEGWSKGPDFSTENKSSYSWIMVTLYNYTDETQKVIAVNIYDMWSDMYGGSSNAQRTREELYAETLSDSDLDNLLKAELNGAKYEKVSIGKNTYVKVSDTSSVADSEMYLYLKDGYIFSYSYFSSDPDGNTKDFEKLLKDVDYSQLPEPEANGSAVKVIIAVIVALAVIGVAAFFAFKFFKGKKKTEADTQPMPPQVPSYTPDPDPVVYIPPQQPAYNPREDYTKVFNPQPARNPREDYTKVFTPQSQPTYTVKTEPVVEEAPVKTYDIPISQAPVAIPYQVALNDESDDFEDIFSSPEMAQTANIKPAANPFVKTDEPQIEPAEETAPAEQAVKEEAPAPVVIPKPVKYCPQCDKTFPSGFFCPTCGNLLESK